MKQAQERVRDRGKDRREATVATGPRNGTEPMFTPLDLDCPLVIGKCTIGTLVYFLYAWMAPLILEIQHKLHPAYCGSFRLAPSFCGKTICTLAYGRKHELHPSIWAKNENCTPPFVSFLKQDMDLYDKIKHKFTSNILHKTCVAVHTGPCL